MAEISLPPGAVVNQGALEQNLAAAGWHIRKVNVQSGAVTVEGSSRSERVQFLFDFSVPYPIKAQALPTVVYSVGDPHNRATLPPVWFEIK